MVVGRGGVLERGKEVNKAGFLPSEFTTGVLLKKDLPRHLSPTQ